MNQLKYGSLEKDVEKILSTNPTAPEKQIANGVPLDFLLSKGDAMAIDEERNRIEAEHQRRIMKDLESKQRIRTIAVPTDDAKVRQFLLSINEPTTCFGEGPYERRERLRQILGSKDENTRNKLLLEHCGLNPIYEEEEETEEFFTEGIEKLKQVRFDILKYSLGKAKERIQKQKQYFENYSYEDMKGHLFKVYKSVKEFQLEATQYAAERPLSSCAFSPNSEYLLTACFDGKIKLWKIPSCEMVDMKFEGHSERISGISWHPQATLGLSLSGPNFASGAADGSVKLWSLDGREHPLVQLDGHVLRVATTKFHPNSKLLGSAGYDLCWKLWDLETGEELLLQEGHAREVYSLAFHPDGSLAASGGLDNVSRIWDLRTGRSIMLIQGHTQSIVSIDFSPNGYEVATASSDNTLRIHDLRKLKSNLHIVPAHTNLVTCVKFNRNQNVFPDFAVTSGFDGKVKIWSVGDWKPLKILSTGSEINNKLMTMDLSSNGKFIAAGLYDKTFKLWRS